MRHFAARNAIVVRKGVAEDAAWQGDKVCRKAPAMKHSFTVQTLRYEVPNFVTREIM